MTNETKPRKSKVELATEFEQKAAKLRRDHMIRNTSGLRKMRAAAALLRSAGFELESTDFRAQGNAAITAAGAIYSALEQLGT